MFDCEEDCVGEPEPAEEFKSDEKVAGDGIVSVNHLARVVGHRFVNETRDGSEKIPAYRGGMVGG